MNRNTTILSVLFVACLISGLYSCTKKTGPTTVLDLISGKWKLTSFAPDNGNGALIYAPLDKNENWQWVFNGDGTGNDIESWNGQDGVIEAFSFKVFGGDSLWIGTATHDTSVYYISEANANDMILTKTFSDSDGIRLTQGYFFNKE